MTRQRSYFFQECPVCGRPLFVRTEYSGRLVACQHCRGWFVASNPGAPKLEAAPRSSLMLHRAALLLIFSGITLGRSGRSVVGWSRRAWARASVCWLSSRARRQRRRLRSLNGGLAGTPPVRRRLKRRRTRKSCLSERPSVLLVEHRDEVFARLAADFAQAGLLVLWAQDAYEAVNQYVIGRPNLVVANTELPGASGWLLAAKLRIVDPEAHVWLYKPHKRAMDGSIAQFLRVEALIHYGGDLLGLSDRIMDCLAGRDVGISLHPQHERPKKTHWSLARIALLLEGLR